MKMFRKMGLTLVLGAMFLLSLSGQIATGLKTYNEDRQEKYLPPLDHIGTYLMSGHFISSLGENMESEFLQMALFVYLTIFLYQKGSAESKKFPEEMTSQERQAEAEEEAYCLRRRQQAPILWRLYENSLTLALVFFFVIFFFVHAYGSHLSINEQKQNLHKPLIGFWEVFGEEEFWFESFQNWQSEFFSIVMLGLFSVFLRQKDSAQSKKMSDPNWKTGDA
jgi:hypothetical protein